jgi:hypothetical protein
VLKFTFDHHRIIKKEGQFYLSIRDKAEDWLNTNIQMFQKEKGVWESNIYQERRLSDQ